MERGNDVEEMPVMKLLGVLLSLAFLGGRAVPCAPAREGEVQAAIQKLAAAGNFGWVAMTIEETEGKDSKLAETVEGQRDRAGWCRLSNPKAKNGDAAYLKGDRIAVLLPEGWKILDVQQAPPAAGKPDKTIKQAQQFMKAKSPLEELRSFLGRIEDLRPRENGIYGGHYTSLDVPIIIERARAAGHKIPDLGEPEARINFRIEDGLLASFELVISGQALKAKKGQVVETLLAISVDFIDAGTTFLEIPDEVRKLLD